jgi:NADH dehydrogenase (ubiquinone) 1 alpha subcomplex subunit 13
MTESLTRGVPGIKSIKDLPVLQDAPPPGGFPSIRIERRLPNTGPTGAAIFAVTAAIVGYGFYQMSQQKRETRFSADEIFTVRQIVNPILQAEWDLRYLEHERKKKEEEARIMKDVPGWVPGEPTTKHRWLPPLESWAKRSLI